jgi:hypothetical protein
MPGIVVAWLGAVGRNPVMTLSRTVALCKTLAWYFGAGWGSGE